MMFMYVYSYYSWAACATTGFRLLDIGKIYDFVTKHIDTYFQQKKEEHKINRKWINIGILACIACAGAIAAWVFV